MDYDLKQLTFCIEGTYQTMVLDLKKIMFENLKFEFQSINKLDLFLVGHKEMVISK